MIYRNGKKISALFRNGKDIKQAFRNGKLVWQKTKPEESTKRVKSITVGLPAWGDSERIWWESALRAIPDSITGYYIDALVAGVGVRLRGGGGRYKAEIKDGEIVIPSNLLVNDEDVYVGMNVKITAKFPATSKTYTSRSSTNSYKSNATYWFADAPFVEGSSVVLSYSIDTSLKSVYSKAYATLNGTVSTSSTAIYSEYKHTSRGSKSRSVSLPFATMVNYKMEGTENFVPSVLHVLTSSGALYGATLKTPACNHTFDLKITKITTY